MIEDFDTTATWPWSPWVPIGIGGSVISGCAHDGPQGITDPNWHYRTDVTLGFPGEKLWIWVKPGSGRCYMGVGATSMGAWSLVAAPNTGELIIQRNSNYSHEDLASVSQSWFSDTWYKLEVTFEEGSLVTGRLYGSDGTTLLNTVSTSLSGFQPAGVAIRSFANFCEDSFEKEVLTFSWLSAYPTFGNIPGGSSLDIAVTFDATDLDSGDYDANIVISNNDPDEPMVTIPAHLHVTGAPDITISNDSFDYCIVFIGTSVTDSLVISNAGTDLLTVGNISPDNSDYTVDTTNFNLDQGESQAVLVTFRPSTTGIITGTLTISSNDPDEPIVTVSLQGEGMEPPDISVSIESLSDSLFIGDSSAQVLTISNTGVSDLSFDISIVGADTASVSVDLMADDSVRAQKVIAVGKPISLDELDNQGFSSPRQLTVHSNDLTDKRMPFKKNHSKIGSFEQITGEEVFGNTDNEFFGGPRTRGNLFTCTTSTNLIEHRFYLNPSASTQLWFLVYEGNLQSGIYDLISASDVTPADPGDGWYSSGHVNVSLVAGKYYLIVASFEESSSYYNQQYISPYPIPASFGELTAGAGWDWEPTVNFPPDSTQYIPASAFRDPVAYYQTLVTGSGITWLDVDPTSGNILGSSSLDIAVTFDATNLDSGDYDANIVISSNDPDEQEITIPVYLAVNKTGIEDHFMQQIPKRYVLYQNYPNPFNPVTYIYFGLPKACVVKIELYNILGQRAATLLNIHKPAGYHVVEFDASRMASGMYFYKMRAGDFQKVRKMLLLK